MSLCDSVKVSGHEVAQSVSKATLPLLKLALPLLSSISPFYAKSGLAILIAIIHKMTWVVWYRRIWN